MTEHGDRQGRHYYTTASQTTVYKYSSGDPGGRHVSYDLATARINNRAILTNA